MAKSKYEYVKEFESQEKCLPNCWLVLRVDGRGFSKFADRHRFRKPNDSRSLNLMNAAAKELMKEFPDIVLAYGQSDEYSFVLRKDSALYNRRPQKLVSVMCSMFTAYYIINWSKFFNSEALTIPPVFDGRIVQYPSDSNLRDYLAWRQTDVHINNLYNTCFWNLVQKKRLSHQEAEEQLKGTVSSEKNEMLFSEFGINYNNEPEQFRKGTTIIKAGKKKFEQFNTDIIGNTFWDEHKEILGKTNPANSHCRQIIKVNEKVEHMQVALSKRKGPIPFDDKARLHVAENERAGAPGQPLESAPIGKILQIMLSENLLSLEPVISTKTGIEKLLLHFLLDSNKRYLFKEISSFKIMTL